MNYILGGDGFIGGNVVRAFDTIPLSHDLRGNAKGKLASVQSGDIVFHAAHYGSIDECAKNPEVTREINVTGTIDFFEEVQARNAFPVYFSTNMVFDGSKSFYCETDLPNPSTEYGRQKREVEEYIQENFKTYLIARMTKVYGSGSNSFIESWLEALQHDREIKAARDMYGAPVHIADVMLSLQRFLQEHKTGVAHVSGPKERSMEEIARLLAAHLDANPTLVVPISISDLSLIEARPLHNSLACDTLRDIPEVLQTFYF